MAFVTPWCSDREFLRVAGDILGGTVRGWRSAGSKMNVWKMRVDRLPAGVETSMSLVQAQLALHDSPHSESLPLTLAAAINRFLNLASHLGERKFGLTKYHEAAAKIGIPGWVVDLRHETTHGHMPKLNSLKEGLDFSVRWLAANYWQPEADAAERHLARDDPHDPMAASDEFSKLHQLLDCYGYLKIYSIWGTQKVGELADQEELYQHISELWESFQEGRKDQKKKRKVSIDNIRVNDALVVLNGELVRYLAGYKGDRDFLAKVLVKVLLDKELILPGEEFLASLVEESEKNLSKVREKLPSALVAMWADVLRLLVGEKVLPELLLGLYNVARGSGERLKRDLACGWIAELCRSTVRKAAGPSRTVATTKAANGRKQKKKPAARQEEVVKPVVEVLGILTPAAVAADPKFNEFVHFCLNHPSEALVFLLPHVLLLRTPKLAKDAEALLKNLLEIHLGTKTSSVVCPDDFAPHTLASLLHGGEDKVADVVKDNDDNPWSEVDDAWINLPIGLASNQTLDSLDLELDRGGQRQEGGGEAGAECLVDFSKPSDLFTVQTIDWKFLFQAPKVDVVKSLKVKPVEEVPAFYRNAQSVNNKRKR